MVTVLLVAYRRFSKRVKAPIFPPHKFWFEEIATALVVLKESHVQLHCKICGGNRFGSHLSSIDH